MGLNQFKAMVMRMRVPSSFCKRERMHVVSRLGRKGLLIGIRLLRSSMQCFIPLEQPSNSHLHNSGEWSLTIGERNHVRFLLKRYLYIRGTSMRGVCR